MSSERPARGTRADYRYFVPMTTRWMDNDPYGHVNNVIYHAWFDASVNRFLITRGLLDIGASDTIALTAENGCRYHGEISYPEDVTVGVRVGRLGRSSVRYESAAFRADDDVAAAEGFFVHVYVARDTRRPVPIPDPVRSALATLVV